MKKRVLFPIVTVALSAFIITGCQTTDLVSQSAQNSFNQFISSPDIAVTHATLNVEDSTLRYWQIQSPSDPFFLMAYDSASGDTDGAISFDATEFVAAGLALEKLPPGYTYDKVQNRLVIAADFGDKKYASAESATTTDPDQAKAGIQATFKDLISQYRDRIGYHETLDHFGIDLGNGNMFEYAKTMSTNSLDMVFVLNPEPFISAGLAVDKLTNWKFAQVEVMDKNNKKIAVDKLLMPFDLKGGQ